MTAPRPGGKVWHDDQREVHRQIFEGEETVDYAFMGQDPNAADNRWLRQEHRAMSMLHHAQKVANHRTALMTR